MQRKETLGVENLTSVIEGISAGAVLGYAVLHNGLDVKDAFTVLNAYPKLQEKFRNLPEALKEIEDLDLFEASEILKAIVLNFRQAIVQIQELQESYSD